MWTPFVLPRPVADHYTAHDFSGAVSGCAVDRSAKIPVNSGFLWRHLASFAIGPDLRRARHMANRKSSRPVKKMSRSRTERVCLKE